MGLYININASTVTGVNTTPGSAPAGVAGIANQVAPQQSSVYSVLEAFGCPESTPLPEQITDEVPAEGQGDPSPLAPATRIGPSNFFLTPSRTIDAPASQASRVKIVIDQSIFFASGSDTSAARSVDTRGRIMRVPDVRYPAESFQYSSQVEMDALRYVLGGFWTVPRTQYQMIAEPKMYLPYGSDMYYNRMFRDVKCRLDLRDPRRFTITLRPNYNFFRTRRQGDRNVLSPDLPSLKSYVLGIEDSETYGRPLINGSTYHDYVHDVKMPFFSSEKQNANIGRVLDADITLSSNYMIREFREGQGGLDIINPYRVGNPDEDIDANSTGIYYDNSIRLTDISVEDSITRDDSVLAFSPAHMEHFDRIKREYKNSYPMVVNINFATSQGGEMPRILKTQSNVVKELAMSFTNRSDKTGLFTEIISETIEEMLDQDNQGEIQLENDKFIQNQRLEKINVLDSLDAITPPSINIDKFPLHKRKQNQAESDDPSASLSRFFARLERTINIAKLKEMESSKSRTFKDILEGKKCYAEPIAYLVEKHTVNSAGNPDPIPVQTFVFMDNDDVDRIDFIDPQLTYKQRYLYRISVMNLVVGNEYVYENMDVGSRFETPTTVQRLGVYYYLNERYTRPFLMQNDQLIDAITGEPYNPLITTPKQKRLPMSLSTYSNEESAGNLMKRGIEPETSTQGVIWQNPDGVSDFNAPSDEDIRKEIAFRKQHISQTIMNFQLAISGPILDSFQTRTTENQDRIVINGSCIPKARIIKVPYFQKEIFADDAPPLSPDIDIVPFKGITNQLRITMTSRTGEEVVEPIAMRQSDIELFNNARLAQGRSSTGPIKFLSDDPPSSYEVYRVSTMPSSYKDFEKSLRATVSTNGSSASSLIDEIEPNTRYYYMFRSVDAGSHVSNPSRVFIAELISTDDGMYLEWTTFKFPKREKVKSISIDQFIAIRSSLDQRNPELPGQRPDGDSAFELPPDLIPGPSDNRMWGRTFVLRVKSKNSQNVLDIKFNCVNDMVDRRSGQPQSTSADEVQDTAAAEGILGENTNPMARKAIQESLRKGRNEENLGGTTGQSDTMQPVRY